MTGFSSALTQKPGVTTSTSPLARPGTPSSGAVNTPGPYTTTLGSALGGMATGGIAQPYTQYTNTKAFEDAYRAALGLAEGQALPEMYQVALGQLQNQGAIGYAYANENLQSGILNQGYGFDQDRLGLAQQGLGIQQQAADRGINNADQYMNLAAQLFGLNNTGINLSQEQFDIGNADYLRGILGDATARGAVQTPGYRSDLSSNAQTVKNQYGQFDNQRGVLGVNYEKEKLSLSEQKQQAIDTKKGLDLKAQELGIDAKELEANLTNGLQKLNIDTMFTVDSLMNAILQGDFEQQIIAGNIINQALGMAPYLQQMGIGTPAPMAYSGNSQTVTKYGQFS